MIVRNLLVAVIALGLAISPTTVSRAEEGLGVGTQIAGMVCATSQSVGLGTDDNRIGSEEVVGCCWYVGVTTLNGRIQFVFSGIFAAYSTNPVSQPQAVVGTCKLISSYQAGVPGSEPTYTQTTSIGIAGATAPMPPALTVPLPLRPVIICISGFAIFGPVFAIKYLQENCSANAL